MGARCQHRCSDEGTLPVESEAGERLNCSVGTALFRPRCGWGCPSGRRRRAASRAAGWRAPTPTKPMKEPVVRLSRVAPRAAAIAGQHRTYTRRSCRCRIQGAPRADTRQGSREPGAGPTAGQLALHNSLARGKRTPRSRSNSVEAGSAYRRSIALTMASATVSGPASTSSAFSTITSFDTVGMTGPCDTTKNAAGRSHRTHLSKAAGGAADPGFTSTTTVGSLFMFMEPATDETFAALLGPGGRGEASLWAPPGARPAWSTRQRRNDQEISSRTPIARSSDQ